jgi:D-alanine--poly(phosphoribitol) ligase subunit 1
MDIIATVRYWSSHAPERPAHISDGRSLSYRDLNLYSDTLSARLSTLQPDNHVPVVVIGHKEPEMLVAFLAAVKSGHPYIPIDISTPQPRIEKIIESSRATVCLTASKVKELLAEMSSPIYPLPQRKIAPDDPWYIIYTSGSTGEPKGVVITTACLESFVDWMMNEQHPSEQHEVFLNQAPFSFDLSVMDLYLCLASGGTLYSITKDEIGEPKQLFISLARSHVSVWVSTPSFAQMCLAEPTFSENMLPRLNKFLFCGETLPPKVAAGLIQRFPAAEVWNTYGPTEATCATTSVQITKSILSHYSPLPVGRPKPDSHIFVVKEDGLLSTDDEHGEVVIAGPNVSPGYLNQPTLTQKVFFYLNGQRAYHTGDLGHFREGMLFFDGRQDNQIKLHGFRIELGDIESNLMALPSVLDAVVIPCLKDGQPDALAAFVILKESPAQIEFEFTRLFKRELGQHIPAYMVPRKFFFIDKFPMTANGKVDRRKLAESLP